MQRPDVEFNLVERPKLPEQIGDTKVKIYEVAANQKCPFRECNNVQCHVPWHKPCAYSGPDTVKKIWPMVLITGIMEVCFSSVLVAFLIIYRYDYDKIYGTEQSRYYICSECLSQRFVCLFFSDEQVYVRRSDGTSSERSHAVGCLVDGQASNDVDPRVLKQQSEFLLSTACIIGLLTLLASVVHFAGNVAVFTYYNMRFIHPIMFEHAP
ncbi:hypothetical protein MSG28_005603 [Choristoneura fumiferana]|uniref:Uncharacterized protein n=1 Tax=Choristoneura fumiferana TaxID=7141 RepID=A0ACC0L0P4_CHOFU|nr:hypothetical protein MSG28_005603 [Choristoneura fumiferana]